jgi:hypothetical protein
MQAFRTFNIAIALPFLPIACSDVTNLIVMSADERVILFKEIGRNNA